MRRTIPFYISFLFKLYFIGLTVFGLLRIVLLLYLADDSIQIFNSLTLQASLIGLQYDTVVLSYVLVLPFLLLFVQSILRFQTKILTKFILVYLCLVFPVLFFITIADIPYFKFFQNRLSESSLQWLGSLDILLKMIFGNAANVLFLVLALSGSFFITFFLYKYCRRNLILRDWKNSSGASYKIRYSIYFLLVSPLCFMGLRGKFSHPINQGDAFYCNDPVLNQMGLNPAFTLLKSYTNKVKLMDDETALKETLRSLQINSPLEDVSPIARMVNSDSAMKKHNILIVLMEGMSADFMGYFGNENHLTPVLDSLVKQSYFFRNAYSAGIHTSNGVFSTLFSFPALKRIRPMGTVPVRTFSGLPYTLRQNGYRNYFFSTHGESFDNLGTFIPHNFFDELYTAEDFPADKIIGPFGVPDDYLFSYAIDKLNEIKTGQPFLAAILTASNHDPYILPEYFNPIALNKELKAVSYADWAIGKFLTEAKRSKWFDSTIFVFVSDHGRIVGNNPYDMPLSYNHIPIIIYAPAILGKPKEYDNFMGQIDIFPTIMGLLNAGYINNTLGEDVLKQKRDCIYFSADDKMGCIDDEWLYIYRFGGGESLHRYRTGSTKDFSKHEKFVFERLKEYALSQTQVAEWMIANDKTSLKK